MEGGCTFCNLAKHWRTSALCLGVEYKLQKYMPVGKHGLIVLLPLYSLNWSYTWQFILHMVCIAMLGV
jgi:hypothetical protein